MTGTDLPYQNKYGRGEKRMQKLFAFFIGVFIFGFLILLTAQEPVWKGEIVYEDGIEVIKNPAEPLYGDIHFELEDDLTIGNEEDENYLFYRTWNMAVDKQGNIYVVDEGNTRIQVFDNDGQYLRTIGRRGQGPGEFRSPQDVFVDDQNGEIFVPDFRSIGVFALNGDHLRSISLETYNRSYCISPRGVIIAETEKNIFEGDEKSSKRRILAALRFIDGGDGSETVIASRPDQLSKIIEGRVAKFGHGFEHVFQMCAIGPEIFAYGFSSDYMLNIIDSSGRPLLKIQKESPPVPISKKEKEAVREKFPDSPIKNVNNIPFPGHKPHFGKILADREWIFVEHFKSPQDRSKGWSMDVFNAHGFYLHKCTFPFRPKIIRDGFAYLIETSKETGDVRVKRYRIKNRPFSVLFSSIDSQ
jgi:hypothetical protein